MNRTFLATTCLLIIGTLSFAQQLTDSPGQSDLMLKMPEPTFVASQAAEYSPSDNVPFFPGGQKALEMYLHNLALYRPGQGEGIVNVQFRVTPTGHLTEIKVLQSPGLQLSQIAVQAVMRMPRWYPAHRSGVAVASLFVLPITFRLH